MVVNYNDIINAIARAEDVALYNARARAIELSNGCKLSKADDDKAIEIESWIQLLTRAAATIDEDTCLDDDIIWQIIQNVNELNRDVDCDVSRTYSKHSSSGGGGNVPSGYVERVLGVNVNNSNPSRPIVEIFVDGVTITGDGTQSNPFVAVAGTSTVVSVNGLTGVVVLTTTNIAEGTRQYFTTARVLATALTGLSVTGGTVTSTDTVLQAVGKLQNQINSLVGGVIYQGTWDASINTPTLTSSVGTKGFYYVVNVAGSTNLNGNTDWQIGDWAIFNGTVWEKVDNTDASLGNASITPITVADLQDLENGIGGVLSTTTLYITTDSTPYKLMCKAETASQLSKTATIVDAVYSGTVYFDLQAGTMQCIAISDVDRNMFLGTMPSDITLGAGSAFNQFSTRCSNILGDNAATNVFMPSARNWTFGNNLKNLIIEPDIVGFDCTASPAYDFLYNKSYSATIFASGGLIYHRYFDVANNRIVITDMATPANVTYIGGGAGGDVVGPASAVDNNIAVFDTTTGKLIKDGGATIASKQNISVEVTGNITAVLNTNYINTANATYTDPTPAQGKGYSVLVVNGTATIGGVAYATPGTLIYRVYHSGAWVNSIFFDEIIVIDHQFTLSNLADATSYFFDQFPQFVIQGASSKKTQMPYDYTLIAANIQMLTIGTLGTSENSTLSIRVNNTTDSQVSNTIKFNALNTHQFASGLNINVLATDYFESKLTTATFATNPTQVAGAITYYFRRKR